MDDRGRLAQQMTGTARWRRRPVDPASSTAPARRLAGMLAHPRRSRLLEAPLPRGMGVSATALVIAASLVYGVVKGGHVPQVVAALKEVRDRLGNAAGFRIVSIALSGHHHVSREEVLAV